MTTGEWIARIKAQCPIFAEVDHVLTSPAAYPYPAALICPVRNKAAEPNVMIAGAMAQDVQITMGIYVVLERRQNGAADYGAADKFDTACAQLRAALVNWSPSGAIEPVTYGGGEMAPYGDGVVTWREDFHTIIEMRFP